jgi:hypothetical protein
MKKAFWNYTEPVTYRVIVVRLLEVKEPPMHWQNAFVGEHRQVVEITHNGRSFLIDNADGSGLLKLEEGGGPGSMSRHVGEFEFIGLVPDDQAQQWSPQKCAIIDKQVDSWQETNHPEMFKKMQALKAAWAGSPMKKMAEDARRKK